MRRIVEAGGLIVPLLMSGLFLLAAIMAPIGHAADRSRPSLLLAAALVSVAGTVAVHLLSNTRLTSIFGMIWGMLVLGAVTYLFAKVRLVGGAGYWQVVGAIMLAIASCGWYFRNEFDAKTGPV